MDLFKWSVPFLMEKVTDMLMHIVKKTSKEDIKDEDISGTDVKGILADEAKKNIMFADASEEKKKRLDAMRAKVKVVARMNRILKTIK